MAKLDILKLYKKEDCYILFLYQIVEKTLKKTIEVIIYVAFFMIPILITRTILHMSISQGSFCTVICRC
jgi:hypothetical protein